MVVAMTPIPAILAAVLAMGQASPGHVQVPVPESAPFAAVNDLHHAAYVGDLEAVRAALEAGADVNEVRVAMAGWLEAPETPLYIAAYQRHEQIVRYLLAAGADPDIRCTEDGTALTIAASRSGTAEILRALLDAGADVLGPRPKGSPALGWSAHGGDPESFVLLLGASRAAGITAEEEANVLERLGYRSNDQHHVLKRLLTWREQDVPTLHVATRGGTAAEVEEQLAVGASATEADQKGWTALHWAVLGKSLPKTRLLLAAGADPNARTSDGCTPLMLAARSGDCELAALLLEADAAPRAADEEDRTALYFAVMSSNPEMIGLLLEKGADPNIVNVSTLTPRRIAETRKQSLGIDVSWAFDGRTRPEWATEPDEVELATELPAPVIEVVRAEYGGDPDWSYVMIELFLKIEPFPLDLAFDVYWRQGEETFPARSFWLPAGTTLEEPLKRQIFAPVEGLGSEIELLLRPSGKVAIQELPDPSAIWGREVRLHCKLVEMRR